jgi:exodeoxyribonuclease V alpha subunit
VTAAPSNHPAESLSGPIERVTFQNEDTGFVVLRVKAKGHRDRVTVVGSLAMVCAGEWINAEGHWSARRISAFS